MKFSRDVPIRIKLTRDRQVGSKMCDTVYTTSSQVETDNGVIRICSGTYLKCTNDIWPMSVLSWASMAKIERVDGQLVFLVPDGFAGHMVSTVMPVNYVAGRVTSPFVTHFDDIVQTPEPRAFESYEDACYHNLSLFHDTLDAKIAELKTADVEMTFGERLSRILVFPTIGGQIKTLKVLQSVVRTLEEERDSDSNTQKGSNDEL